MHGFEEMNAKINRLKHGGGVGYTTEHTAILPCWEDRPVDIPMSGGGLLWHSPLTPTEEELRNGQFWGFVKGSEVKYPVTLPKAMHKDDVVLIFAIDLLLAVAYKAGEHTMQFMGQQVTFNIPKPGIYLTKETHQTDSCFGLSWKTIHPISDKYLPGVCLPVVEMTVEQLEEILSADAGVVEFTEGELYKQLEYAFMQGLPLVLRVPSEAGVMAKILTGDADYIGDTPIMLYSCTITGLSLKVARMSNGENVTWSASLQEEA